MTKWDNTGPLRTFVQARANQNHHATTNFQTTLPSAEMSDCSVFTKHSFIPALVSPPQREGICWDKHRIVSFSVLTFLCNPLLSWILPNHPQSPNSIIGSCYSYRDAPQFPTVNVLPQCDAGHPQVCSWGPLVEGHWHPVHRYGHFQS